MQSDMEFMWCNSRSMCISTKATSKAVHNRVFVVRCGCREFRKVCYMLHTNSIVYKSDERVAPLNTWRSSEYSWNQFHVIHALWKGVESYWNKPLPQENMVIIFE